MGWSPKHIEFKRAHLYDINPVGLGAMLIAAALAVVAYAGAHGPDGAGLCALHRAVRLDGHSRRCWPGGPAGRYYLARTPDQRWRPGESVKCSVCDNHFESDDMAQCPAYGAPICSLCCTLESRCHDRCKTDSRAAEQVRSALAAVLPQRLSERINFRAAHYLVVLVSLVALLAVILGVVYEQQGALHAADHTACCAAPFIKAFALLSLVAAVGAWWMVLGSESRHMARGRIQPPEPAAAPARSRPTSAPTPRCRPPRTWPKPPTRPRPAMWPA